MKQLLLILSTLLFSVVIYSQEEKILIGDPICYSEIIDQEFKHLTFQPYKQKGHYNLEFKSGYQFSVTDDIFKADLIDVLAKYDKVHKRSMKNNDNSMQILGQFGPRNYMLISKKLNPGKNHIRAWENVMSFYYQIEIDEIPNSQGNLIIHIPSMPYFATSKKSPEHYIYIPNECVEDFIKCFD